MKRETSRTLLLLLLLLLLLEAGMCEDIKDTTNIPTDV